MTHDEHSSQFALLGQRRFAPFFWTQFLGAGNDNLFKFAFTVMVTYQLSVGWLPPALAGLVIGALFILPFLLFSATSGQLTDKFPKTRMIRAVKNLEIAIMLVAAYGFFSTNLAVQIPVLLACVFLARGAWQQVVVGIDSYSVVLGYPTALLPLPALLCALAIGAMAAWELVQRTPLDLGHSAEMD